MILRATTAAAVVLSFQAQTPPVFRGTTNLVPLDVRVVDIKGRPVTDLTTADFSVREDGVVQQIRHFSTVQLSPENVSVTPSPSAPAAARSNRAAAAPDAALTTPNQRVFLMVLGRGRLQAPAKGIDAAIRFLRERALPQDRVAISLYNRATDFTVNRDALVEVLTRFKRHNDKIELKLKQYLTSGDVDPEHLPKDIQALIDEVIGGAASVGVREVRASGDTRLIATNNQKVSEAVRRTEISSVDEKPRLTDATDARLAALDGRSFEDHLSDSSQTIGDVGRIYAGLEYLRFVPGEKHLLFIYENSLYTPRAEDDYSLAAAANDARVAIDTIQTGGLGAPPEKRTVAQDMVRVGNRSIPAISVGKTLGTFMATQTQRTLSELTGGHASIQTYADKAMEIIDTVTRSGYLLGYTPSNTSLDGRYRRIEVTTNRPGLTVMYRHGYYAVGDGAVAGYRRLPAPASRILNAGRSDATLAELGVHAKATPGPTVGGSKTLDVEITIDARNISLVSANGLHSGKLDVAVFCGDASEQQVGSYWQNLDINFRDATYERFLVKGLVNTVRVRLTAPAKRVKVVVYDYGSDRTGSVIVKVE